MRCGRRTVGHLFAFERFKEKVVASGDSENIFLINLRAYIKRRHYLCGDASNFEKDMNGKKTYIFEKYNQGNHLPVFWL
jgi:hypothetical protein